MIKVYTSLKYSTDYENIEMEDTKTGDKKTFPNFYGDDLCVCFDDGTVVDFSNDSINVVKKGEAYISHDEKHMYIGKTFKNFVIGEKHGRFWNAAD